MNVDDEYCRRAIEYFKDTKFIFVGSHSKENNDYYGCMFLAVDFNSISEFHKEYIPTCKEGYEREILNFYNLKSALRFLKLNKICHDEYFEQVHNLYKKEHKDDVHNSDIFSVKYINPIKVTLLDLFYGKNGLFTTLINKIKVNHAK